MPREPSQKWPPIFSRSDDDLTAARAKQQQTHQESARLFKKVAQVLLDEGIPEEQVRQQIFKLSSQNGSLIDGYVVQRTA